MKEVLNGQKFTRKFTIGAKGHAGFTAPLGHMRTQKSIGGFTAREITTNKLSFGLKSNE